MFAFVIVFLRDRIGKKEFNKIRGKAIAVHCKTITNFCNQLGYDAKMRQSLIRKAKSNGQKLGLLA